MNQNLNANDNPQHPNTDTTYNRDDDFYKKNTLANDDITTLSLSQKRNRDAVAL